MPYEFKLPDLGEGIAEVELRRWLVREGDRVAEHQTVLEVESDKAVVEVPSPRAGIVTRLLRREGETVKVGEPLLAIAGEAETVSGRPKSVGIVGVLPEEEEEEPVSPVQEQREVRATPLVRKLARERGIDLATLQGSGPHGSVTPEDLERAVVPAGRGGGEPTGPEERLPLRGVRRTIARHLSASQQLTAFVTTMDEADMTDLWKIRNREQQEVEEHHGTHLTFL
ncbi:MAG TPA: biotin/lipoyl-containing protein, partial [Candidatus Methylomirabilis sp.]|nr:biotin/lipoyl-containing protein [Candidatus Methylomirabilis sp.]